MAMNIHPGEILAEEFLAPYGLTASALAKQLDLPANRLTGIVAGKRSVTPETALLLGATFGTTPEFWLNLQQRYDLREAGAAVEAGRLQRARALHEVLQPVAA
jgi:addiction module HigA family antidote